MAISGKRCKSLSEIAIVLVVFSAVHTSVVAFRSKSRPPKNIEAQSKTTTEKLETTRSLIHLLAATEMESLSDTTTQPPTSAVTERSTETREAQTKMEAQLSTSTELPNNFAQDRWKGRLVIDFTFERIPCPEDRIYIDGKCQEKVDSTTSTTTRKPCWMGLPPAPNGECYEVNRYSIIGTPCPTGTQSDLYGKCRQVL